MSRIEEPISPDPENRTTIGPGTNIKLAFLVTIAGVIAWGGWVTSELNTIKSVALVNATSQASMSTKIELLSQRVENLEQRGSMPMQILQKALDKLAEELRVHEVSDAARGREGK